MENGPGGEWKEGDSANQKTAVPQAAKRVAEGEKDRSEGWVICLFVCFTIELTKRLIQFRIITKFSCEEQYFEKNNISMAIWKPQCTFICDFQGALGLLEDASTTAAKRMRRKLGRWSIYNPTPNTSLNVLIAKNDICNFIWRKDFYDETTLWKSLSWWDGVCLTSPNTHSLPPSRNRAVPIFSLHMATQRWHFSASFEETGSAVMKFGPLGCEQKKHI